MTFEACEKCKVGLEGNPDAFVGFKKINFKPPKGPVDWYRAGPAVC